MKLLFLYIILLIWVGFQMVPYSSQPYDMFFVSDQTIQFKTWLYFLLEHIGIIMLCYIIAAEATNYKYACKVFFYIQVLDLVDYLLTYNTEWFKVFGFSITFNVIAALVFSLVAIREYDRING